jgi:hypothetical protein
VTIDLSEGDSDTLLLVLSPSCPYCKINFHNWRTILSAARRARVICLDVTDTADVGYLKAFGIPATATVLRLTPGEAMARLFAGTPTTVLLSPHGVVRWAYSGVMKDEQLNELRGLVARPILHRHSPVL